MSWNGQYSSLPQDDNNPGYGAAAIRDLKTKIEGLFGREHNFDLDLTSNQGKHFAGSAIIDLDSDGTAVNNLQQGRLKGITFDTNYAILTVKGETSDQQIKGYNQVNLDGDETIGGEKTFSTAPVISAVFPEDPADQTIANVGYVNLKTDTSEIEPDLLNVSPITDLTISDFNTNDIYTIIHKADTDNLESLLLQISTELIEVRTAIQANAANNPFGQNLQVTDAVTFAGQTINGNVVATGNITGVKVFGAVWGA
jgi:hypothetical protein